MLYLVDLYEGAEIVWMAETRKEINKAKQQHIEDTDGECLLTILDSLKPKDERNLIDLGLI